MIELIPLERIDDNPYQTRTVYNTEAIEELAADIRQLEPARPETLGLIQVPLGRIVYHEPDGTIIILDTPLAKGSVHLMLKESKNYCIQLAAGHSRLRAFRHLAEADTHWSTMPVDLANLTDSEMADIAWSENAKRRNISAIEEAEAIERAKTELGYTSADIQHRWGLTGSTISNKTRLLQLPVKVQEMIKAGDLRERHARELLPLVQVLKDDKAALKMAKDTAKYDYSANKVSQEVQSLIDKRTWPVFEKLLDFNRWNGHHIPAVCQPACRGCWHNAKNQCLKPSAAREKRDLYDKATLEIAALAAGVEVSSKTWWQHTPESYAVAKERNCDRLAVTRSTWTNHPVVEASDEFEDIYMSCRDGYNCQCLKAQKEAAQAEGEDPWAALHAWREEQKEQAKQIFEQTIDHLAGAFEAALASVDEKGLAYFVCLLRLMAGTKNYIEPDDITYNLESVAGNLAEATAWMNINSGTKTVGRALLHRAEVYQQCQINTPVAEAEARLVILENLFTERELSPHGPSDWMFTAEMAKIDDILQSEPGTTKLRKKLAEYKERYAEEF